LFFALALVMNLSLRPVQSSAPIVVKL